MLKWAQGLKVDVTLRLEPCLLLSWALAMGTCGYTVYCHKGHYFLHYNHLDSYPNGLGLAFLHEIPYDVSKEEFEEWVKLTQEMLDAQYEELKYLDNLVDLMSDKQPGNDIFIEWVYKIDLNNLVFHVNSQPLFHLDNMPPDNVFIRAISFDHFSHRALYKHTPAQFRYDWHAPPLPPPPESLVAYNSYQNRSPTSSIPIYDLLNIPVANSAIELARTAFMEVLVMICMAEGGVGHYVRILENVPDRDHIPQSMLKLALSLVNFAVGPPIPLLPCNQHNDTWDFIWICKDVCLHITTHLDDEDNLKASIGDLVHHINTVQEKVGTIYGVLCSIFHCSIVRVDKDAWGTSFSHMPVLQFLPSFYTRKMSTLGIEALSRLGCQASGVKFLDAISDMNNLERIMHEGLLGTSSMAVKLPIEVWARIGDFVTSPADLVTLASISPQAMSAVADLARYPWIEEFCLVDVIASGPVPPILETMESTDSKDIQRYFYKLGHTKFTAVGGGHCVNVELGLGYVRHSVRSTGHRQTTFKVQTYLSSPVVIDSSEVYLVELDDDVAQAG
jgi:hypothetical protein